MDILRRVREICRASGVPAYDPRSGEGFWRHLVIRHTQPGEIMAHLITAEAPDHYAAAESLGETLVAEFRTLTSFVHSSRSRRAPLAVGEQVEFRLGPKQVEEP